MLKQILKIHLGSSYQFVETPDGKFALYIPEFRNTFDVIDDETVVLYNPVKDSHIFIIDSNGTGEFKELSIPNDRACN